MIDWGINPRGIFNLPLEYAIARGVFGRDLEIVVHDHPTGADYGARLEAGAYDMGQVGTPVYLPAAAAGENYEIVSVGVCNYPPFYLVAEPGIANFAALRGESVAINRRKTCPESLLSWHAHEEGVGEDELNIVEVMAAAASTEYGSAFIRGAGEKRFKAGVLYEPFVSFMEQTAGWKIIGDYPRMAVPSNYCLLLYARKAWARDHREIMDALVSDYFNAVRYARDHLEEMIRVVAPLPRVSGSQLLSALRREAGLWNTEPLVDHAVFAQSSKESERQGRLPANYLPRILARDGSMAAPGRAAV